jgi:tetratricopeptide (TPR) repeat protein
VRRNLQGIRLRTKQDLDQAEQAVWAIYRSHQSVGFEEGYEALLSLRPTVANARHGQALRVLLLIEEKLAWFALPLGRIEMALDHAERAMDRAVEAFKESAGAKDYLLRYGEAALVASVCLQKLHQPELSLSFIRAADEANIAIGDLPGSEHLRQRGASLMQLGKDYDDLADGQLRRAPRRMLRKNEARNDVDLGMSGLRQRAFLHPSTGFDRVLELTEEAATAYGRISLQYAVAAKSAALAGLRYATPESTETALDLLAETSSAPHSPIPHILSITPDLKLSAEQLDLWLRFAMSETPLPPRK